MSCSLNRNISMANFTYGIVRICILLFFRSIVFKYCLGRTSVHGIGGHMLGFILCCHYQFLFWAGFLFHSWDIHCSHLYCKVSIFWFKIILDYVRHSMTSTGILFRSTDPATPICHWSVAKVSIPCFSIG